MRVRRKTTALLVDLVRRELERMSASWGQVAAKKGAGLEPERSREARAHGVVGTFLGLASWWLDCGEDLRLEDVDDLFQELLGHSGLR